MSLKIIGQKVNEYFPRDGNFPETAYFDGLNLALKLDDNHLYVDIGEVDNYVEFYGSVVDDLNKTAGYEKYKKSAFYKNDELITDTSKIVGGVQMPLLKFRRDDILYTVCAVCYTPMKGNRVSKPFIQGHEEGESLITLNRRKALIDAGIVPGDMKDHETIANVAGIYAARRIEIPDDEIFEYMMIGGNVDQAAVEKAIEITRQS